MISASAHSHFLATTHFEEIHLCGTWQGPGRGFECAVRYRFVSPFSSPLCCRRATENTAVAAFQIWSPMVEGSELLSIAMVL